MNTLLHWMHYSSCLPPTIFYGKSNASSSLLQEGYNIILMVLLPPSGFHLVFGDVINPFQIQPFQYFGMILINEQSSFSISSLTEEAAVEVLGLTTAHAIWTALEICLTAKLFCLKGSILLQLPNYTNFRAFGCLVYPYLRDYSAHKLAPRSIPCVFIGYNPQYKGYKCLDPDSSRIYITRHARFDEVTFPFASTANPNALSTLQLCTFLEDGPPHIRCPGLPESPVPTDLQGPSSSSPVWTTTPPTTSDDVSSHGAPPATAPTEPSSFTQRKIDPKT
ncbi:retrovirus-related pol polyprotein from transposon RE1 [Tanacetum coccineum]|uniref:Retrovirus-related pol polyprotein from transposon RE1 n=1 Tax=Tanacetum coccineum TaxID=301880 RepID=A0ABQ4YBX4_9ASTR